MEKDMKELNTEELEKASGGSIFNRESSILNAGIELWKEYGKVRGEFGNLWNSGDYYFKGKLVDQDQIDALEYYRDKNNAVAPSVDVAVTFYNRHHKQSKRKIVK